MIVIHVGLHKTGTKFLQQRIFPNLENVNFQWVCKNKNVDYILAHIGTFSIDNTKVNIISQERFSGIPLKASGKFTRNTIANKLYEHYPNARIIVCTRELEPWLYSCWKQYIRNKFGRLTYEQWRQKINPLYFDMDGYVSYLKRLFKAGVFSYTMEEFVADNDKVIRRMCKFIGVPVPNYKPGLVHQSLTDEQIEKMRKRR